MNVRLAKIQNWDQYVRQANWSVTNLAKLCSVSERTLRRYIQENRRLAPKAWMAAQRQRLAFELLRDGSSVKETSMRLGYKNPETFSREFKKFTGKCPFEMTQILIAGSLPIIYVDKWPKKL